MGNFPFRFGPGPCCCPCWEFLDNFNRTPDTDIGSNWHEQLGDWDIVGSAGDGRLHEKHDEAGGTADAMVICTKPVPYHSAGEMNVSVWFCNPQTGDINYIYPACTTIHTHGPCVVKFECTSAPNLWTATVYINGTAEGTRNFDAPNYGTEVSPAVYAAVCVDDHDSPDVHMIKVNMWVVNTYGQEPLWIDDHDAGSGRYAGLGHDNVNTGVLFDNFGLYELRLASGEICSECFCSCHGHPPNKALHAVFYNATDRAACMDGIGWDMNWQWALGVGTWHGHVTVPATAEGGLATEFAYSLHCPVSNPSNPDMKFSLVKDSTDCGKDGNGPWLPIAVSSTCDPFSLVFGPFHLQARLLFGGNDTECDVCFLRYVPAALDCIDPPADHCFGEFYIVITEA
jgi:hypothetical protein